LTARRGNILVPFGLAQIAVGLVYRTPLAVQPMLGGVPMCHGAGGMADLPRHHMNLMRGAAVADEDFGTTWTLRLRLDEIDRDRRWEFSIHRGSIHGLPA
jgi:hypothetical protein